MLAGPLADPRLGGRVAATVVDAETGEVLLDRSADTYVLPASTAKLVTAAARARVRGRPGPAAGHPAGRRGPAGRGGAGRRRGRHAVRGPRRASRRRTRGRPGWPRWPPGPGPAGLGKVTRVVVDGSLFTGPRLAPGWDPVDVTGGYVAPITAVMVDGGRQGPGVRARSAEPDLAAGRALAAALGAPTAPVVRGTAPAGARLLARVESQPVSRLVEQMLLASDNVLADLLARQVALAEGRPASFAGAVAASRAVLGRLGLPAGGDRLVDGSGLSMADRLTPALLVGGAARGHRAGPTGAARRCCPGCRCPATTARWTTASAGRPRRRPARSGPRPAR